MSDSWSNLCEGVVTLLELEQSLPNGLHDAEIKTIEIDYVQRRLMMDLDVWVGDLAASKELREAYQSGRLQISGLIFLIMEAPDTRYHFRKSTDLTIDGCDARERIEKDLLDSLPPEAFFRSFYVNDWNSFMHMAATNAEIFWTNGGVVTYR
jgi:hypothetical protein